MIRELTIKNYKSILDHTIELGRINVFIGENGCGKTNILEAVAMAGAVVTDKLSVEELFNRGMRVAKPSIMRSSFPGARGKENTLGRLNRSKPKSEEPNPEDFERVIGALNSAAEKRRSGDILGALVGDFAIYNANALALRGLQTVSRRTPVGIYGETLDYAISALEPEVWDDLLERAKCVSWLEDIIVDPADPLKYQGHKLGKSQSILYFHDKHMRRKNNIFSAENVNEGVLHVLFHLTLFVSEGTPRVLGARSSSSRSCGCVGTWAASRGTYSGPKMIGTRPTTRTRGSAAAGVASRASAWSAPGFPPPPP
jgi:energy-coupling factor transporter ATP-binding protein EcfA2